MCVKMEDCGLNTFFLNRIQFYEMYSLLKLMVLEEKEKGQKETLISLLQIL